MYSSSNRSSYTLPRTSSYVSSRYTSVGSSLPPVASRYTPSSRYSSTSSYRSTYTRPTTYLSPSRYNTSSSVSSSSTLDSTSSWRSTVSSPSLARKSSISDSVSSSGYSSRRQSFSSGLNYRSGSISSLTPSPAIDSYRSTSYVSPSLTTTATKEEWTPRTSRVNSISSSSGVTGDISTYGSSYRSGSFSVDSNKLAAGRVGLNNLGNTCFMNAVLQCLCHTQPLVDYCKRGSFNSDVNHRSPTGGDLIKAFASLINVLWSNNANNSVSPDHVKRELQKYAPRFAGFNQQDAQELLRYLLQGLHDDINRVTTKTTFRPTTNDYSSLSQHASDSWRRYQAIDDSKIVDIFAGQLRSTLKCTECSHSSVSFDPFWDLSLPIPDGGSRVSLQQCFRLFTSPETLDGSEKPFCERCKSKKRSTKQLEINKCPPILVIHLKRFSSGGHYRNKLNVTVDCPERNLDLSQFTSNDCINYSTLYNLYGVVDHYGSSSSGHYTAKCKNLQTSEWNEFNDSMVTEAKSSDLITDKAYLLFYEQQGRRGSRL